jgi:fibronectin type 3 domain-containing protein
MPPSLKPTAGANASPSNTTAKVVPPLAAKSLGFNSEATTYHVYDVTAPATEAAEDPYAVTVPAAITPAPIADTEFAIKGVAFDVERCFEVRPVDRIFGVTVIGPASPRTCITPKDTYAPAAPRSLAAIAGAGVINLIWDANGEDDLAGYLVLRGEAPGDTLQPVTTEPVAVTSYRDESVRVGTRYFYTVVAVDRAGNRSAQSNRAEETARQ